MVWVRLGKGEALEEDAETGAAESVGECCVRWISVCVVSVVEEVAAVERLVRFGGGRRPTERVDASSR